VETLELGYNVAVGRDGSAMPIPSKGNQRLNPGSSSIKVFTPAK
jgi:hypothetical protein